MQEIKHLILRVGTTANVEEYVFDGPMADAHIQGYLNQGFEVHTVHPGSVDQSTNSMSVFYVLIRETQPDMDVPKAQDQINQMVSESQGEGHWEIPATREVEASVPA